MQKSKKVLYLDTETTGTDVKQHGIIELAAIMEIDGESVETFSVKFQPHIGASVDMEALKVSNTTVDELKTRISSAEGFVLFVEFLDRYINRFDREDKAYPAGYNVLFDLQFIDAWFKIHGNRYGIGSYQNWKILDPLPVLRIMDFKGVLMLPDYKLGTVCNYFGIHHNAHNALSDITATREIMRDILCNGVRL